ncbi:MAG: cation:proton antiporter [Gallionellales bacterium RIFCSPLOWO2_12_FULL_57_18]|nr:MAG: cation:proton antiporter [Gallionellales bacterium RIFCSPLOWO2_12_FULL_57_18]OGS95021.1 MAG: cation:proton antiporter [Gallionellales bacterium RIFCSPLOWO2_02_FULL_57_47]OGT11640.1 MAG: cation:proton antiporter [Gallionellales bacterium RIFCSPHIGHO2_02_FULL_57_16]
METLISIKPLLAVLVSAIAAVLVMLSYRRPNLREGWSLGAGVIKFLIVVSMTPVILSGGIIQYTVFKILPGVELAFKVDGIGLLFATTSSFLWIITTVYSMGYMRTLEEHAQTRYYTCFAIALSSAMGVAFAGNLFTLFFFYEILSLCTLPLVIHNEGAKDWDAGRKYLLYLVGASSSILLGAIILTYTLTGTLDFNKAGMFSGLTATTFSGMEIATLLTVMYFMFLYGFAKAGLMPMHNWLPSAMVAPTPVSALLHAVAVVKVGAFCIVRLVTDVFGVPLMQNLHLGDYTAIIASITILASSAYALTQDNLKMRLAYSTVSQLSYIVLGVALLTGNGIIGGIIHIVNHAVTKITLFFCAGSIYVASHKTNISQMSGIARKMPWTIAAFTIASLSIIGVPLFAGFITKWHIAIGTIETKSWVLLGVLLTSSLLNVAYFAPVVYKAVFGTPPEDGHEGISEAPLKVLVPLLITAAGTVVLGIFPDHFLNLIKVGLLR